VGLLIQTWKNLPSCWWPTTNSWGKTIGSHFGCTFPRTTSISHRFPRKQFFLDVSLFQTLLWSTMVVFQRCRTIHPSTYLFHWSVPKINPKGSPRGHLNSEMSQPHPCSCSSELFFDRGPMTASGCFKRRGSWTSRCDPPCHLQRHHCIKKSVYNLWAPDLGPGLRWCVRMDFLKKNISNMDFILGSRDVWSLCIPLPQLFSKDKPATSNLATYHEWTSGSRDGELEEHASLGWKEYDYINNMLVNSFKN
jgi:hypothetical protein